MTDIRQVKLEIFRSGPAHNQLLSPLTPYYAICGSEGGITIKFPFEHRQLLNRLTRLRYATKTDNISSQQREAEVRELGEIIGRVLGQIPTLVSELGHAGSNDNLVHLRLSISAYELALLPYELAIGTNGFPASGSPLFLQPHIPITITREVRHGQPLPIKWNRPPRILFVYACPEGFNLVPYQEHLEALRLAIDPWVKWKATNQERVEEVKSILSIIPNATLNQIRNACLENEFSYIHILAHGAAYEEEGEQHFGLALSHESNPCRVDVVSGERLAIALAANNSNQCQSNQPTLVSLSTCDSGNVNAVMTPAGSIAHALHAGGIPWVIASQFPLWMRASSLATETLFSGILNGDDPRCILYRLRQRLRTDSAGTHDWASIVAYSTIPPDFEQQVVAFRDEQIRAKLNVKFDLADQYPELELPKEFKDIEDLFDSIRDDHKNWLKNLADDAEQSERSEILGMRAAAEKRIGLLCKDSSKRLGAFQLSLDYYKQSLKANPLNDWAITQYLSMLTVLASQDIKPESEKDLAEEYRDWWVTSRQIARWKLEATEIEKIWAFSVLAELELLGVIFNVTNTGLEDTKKRTVELCKNLITSAGMDHFPIDSTRRQFKRDTDTNYCKNKAMIDIADAALVVLGGS